jgi:AcrR family transcriptional regulator
VNEHSFIILRWIDMTDRKSRKKQITEEREEQILKAAMEVFTRKGYSAATIPEIAEMAGVAVGTIYNYYPGKRELFVAVIKHFIITIPLLDLIDKMPGAEITDTFRQIMQNRFNLIKAEPVSRIPSLMGEIQRDPELRILWTEQFIHPFFTRMEGVYCDMVASGKFRQMEPAIATRAIGGLIFGFIMLRLMEGEASPINQLPQKDVVDAMVEFMLYGLSTDTV